MKTLILTSAVLAAAASLTSAAVLDFNLQGVGGPGLLRTNERPTVPATGGSGGEILGGITYDDVTNFLVIRVGWGQLTDPSFSNLTGNVIAAHVHGNADQNNTASPIINLHTAPGFTSSGDQGGFNGSFTITEAQEADLKNGLWYINAHTAVNGGGEIRGNMVLATAIPEPSTGLLGALAFLGFLVRRRR